MVTQVYRYVSNKYIYQPKISFYNLFQRLLMMSSFILHCSRTFKSFYVASSIFYTNVIISSAQLLIWMGEVLPWLEVFGGCVGDYISHSPPGIRLIARLSILFAFLMRLPSSSGFQNFKKIQQSSCSMTPGTQLAIYQICCLLMERFSFFRIFVLMVFQFYIFLLVALAGGQLCREISLGLQKQSSQASITPSEKSRVMFFFGRENGTVSTILQTYYSSSLFIQILQPLNETQKGLQGQAEGLKAA